MGKEFDHSKYKDWIDPGAVTPYERNAKKHDDKQIANIANSIQRFGWQQDTVITTDRVLVIGHGRRLAAIRLGCEMPYHVIDKTADQLTDEDIRELRIADNQTNAETGFDWELLAADTADLTFEGFNFEFVQPGGGVEDFDIIEDDPPMPQDTAIAKRGQIWQLGRHRLMCGDSTSTEDVKLLMDGQEADLLLTDPPYNLDYSSNKGVKILNDKQEDEGFRKFLNSAFLTANAVMKKGAGFYIWHADTEGYNFRGACRDIGWDIRQCLVWNKNTFPLGRQDYQWKHEPCLYGWKEGASHYFIDVRDLTTVFEDAPDIDKMKKEEMAQLLKELLEGGIPTTVINENKPSKSELHPTMKPIRLLAKQIQYSSKPDWRVLDLFGGSGSTLIACEELDRQCYMMELDPHYVDVIIQRWENFTGKKAVLLNG